MPEDVAESPNLRSASVAHIDKRLNEINNQLDALALSRRLKIEAEHLKRIKSQKNLRLYCEPSCDRIRIATRVMGECTSEDSTPFWDAVQRVVLIAGPSNMPRISVNPQPENEEPEDKAQPVANNEQPQEDTTNNTPNTATTLLAETEDSARPEPLIEPHEQAASPSLPPFTPEAPFTVFEWTSQTAATAFVAMLRPEHTHLQLLIRLRNPRAIHRFSRPLARLLKKSADTRQNAIKDLYRYVNNNKLSDHSTGRVTCNRELAALFGTQCFHFACISQLLAPHLLPIGYCAIDVPRLGDTAWDIPFEYDDLDQKPVLFTKPVQDMQRKLELLQSDIHKSTERLRTLEEFATDPIAFVNRRIALESEGLGAQTAFYDNLTVQTAVYELIKQYEQ